MRFRSLAVAGLVWLSVASVGQSQVIEIRPKKPPNETPLPRPEPAIPVIKSSPPEGVPLKTIVEIEILALEIQGDPISQNWGKLFEESGATIRIRNGRAAKIGITEKVRGSLRSVTASGLLDRDGALSFGAVSFHLNEPERVKEWINELKTYGAQGAPNGKPMWGLSRTQFAVVNEQMTRPLTVVTTGKSLLELVAALQDEAELPVRLTIASQTWLKDSSHDRPTTVDVAGFSTGTGLAIALNEIGIGLRPTRTAAGSIEYEVLPLEQLSDPWPMGWEPLAETSRDRITPELFKFGVVGFEKSPLSEVLAAIATEAKTPIVIDIRRCLAKKIDVHTVTVSSPSKRTAWALVMSQCVRQAGLHNSYRQDEAGRGFVLVAPFEAKVTKPE